jgi:hypothetical protein
LKDVHVAHRVEAYTARPPGGCITKIPIKGIERETLRTPGEPHTPEMHNKNPNKGN